MKRVTIAAAIAITVASLSGCDLYPPYRVYSQRMNGEAQLAEAESAKKVQILDAEAKKQSAQSFADAEVIRARGVAQANKIIGDSLKGNEAYLHYLWIDKMAAEQNKTVVYVPTETGMPVMESSRLTAAAPAPAIASK